MALTRRCFLSSTAALAASHAWADGPQGGKGHQLPSAVTRYADPATEFPVFRLTDPEHASLLPAYYNRAISRHNGFLLYASDVSGRFEAYRLDLKTGISRQLTEAAKLDPQSVVLFADDRGFGYIDEGRLVIETFSGLRTKPIALEKVRAANFSDDALYASVVQFDGSKYRLSLVQTTTGARTTLAESDEEIAAPLPRPRRASVAYQRGGGLWLANYDGQQNYRLKIAEGGIGPAQWSPDGRSLVYLNYPSEPHRLNNLREFTPDTNEDKRVADTSQFVRFERNSDGTVFVGASGSKASPFVLLMVRSVRREFTICEHRASDPALVSPRFSSNSQRVYFGSDRHGKPAIYSMAVEKFVTETEAGQTDKP
jgi:oligogalacturonide lyase